MVLKIKDEVFFEAKERQLNTLTAEELIPIFIVLLVRSNARNHFLCARLHFLKTFLGEEELSRNGEALYYLVTLESAVHQIRNA
jgi:hypothetical protein